MSEQILNSTSAQIGYTVPFMSVYAGKYGQKINQKQSLLKLSTTQKKQTTQNILYDTRPGNDVGLFYNASEPTRGRRAMELTGTGSTIRIPLHSIHVVPTHSSAEACIMYWPNVLPQRQSSVMLCCTD